jgi:hypothetical protein
VVQDHRRWKGQQFLFVSKQIIAGWVKLNVPAKVRY